MRRGEDVKRAAHLVGTEPQSSLLLLVAVKGTIYTHSLSLECWQAKISVLLHHHHQEKAHSIEKCAVLVYICTYLSSCRG
jgi:c-di-AMP phosphodiesterase-like protein